MKSVHIRSYSGTNFPAFGLNTERYGVSLRIQSECGKIRTRITPNMDTFYAVILFWLVCLCMKIMSYILQKWILLFVQNSIDFPTKFFVDHTTRIFFFCKKPVYKKPRTRYPQITPNLRNFKNYKKKHGILT